MEPMTLRDPTKLRWADDHCHLPQDAAAAAPVIDEAGQAGVERLITVPVETEMNGLQGLTVVRSISLYGLSSVRITFARGEQSRAIALHTRALKHAELATPFRAYLKKLSKGLK
jgi:hypothetical protein